MKNRIETRLAPSHWASFLINNDPSGIEASERNKALDWLVRMAIGNPVSCEDAGFLKSHDAWKESPLPTDCQSYAFLVEIPQERGAPMGKPNVGSVACEGKWTLQRVRINFGGYDASGAYWGIGVPLYWAESFDSQVSRYFRARTRDAAKAMIHAEFPNAKFYR